MAQLQTLAGSADPALALASASALVACLRSQLQGSEKAAAEEAAQHAATCRRMDKLQASFVRLICTAYFNDI